MSRRVWNVSGRRLTFGRAPRITGRQGAIGRKFSRIPHCHFCPSLQLNLHTCEQASRAHVLQAALQLVSSAHTWNTNDTGTQRVAQHNGTGVQSDTINTSRPAQGNTRPPPCHRCDTGAAGQPKSAGPADFGWRTHTHTWRGTWIPAEDEGGRNAGGTWRDLGVARGPGKHGVQAASKGSSSRALRHATAPLERQRAIVRDDGRRRTSKVAQ